MKNKPSWLLPFFILLLALAYVLSGFRDHASGPVDSQNIPFDLQSFGRIPVMHEGRLKPISTVAGADLLALSGRQSISRTKQSVSATQWLLDVITRQPIEETYLVFRIDHPQLCELMELQTKPTRSRFSPKEVLAKVQVVQEQAQRAEAVLPQQRDAQHRAALKLFSQLVLYHELRDIQNFLPVPPVDSSSDWSSIDQILSDGHNHDSSHPHDHASHANSSSPPSPAAVAFAQSFMNILTAYHQQNAAAFNAAVAGHLAMLKPIQASVLEQTALEQIFQQAQLFYYTTILYGCVLVLAAISWILAGPLLIRTALALGLFTLFVHTAALGWRVYLHGRPPVTDLYSSAIFVGWGAVLGALLLEILYRNAIGSFVAGVIGLTTLIVAHNLVAGDSIKQMSAVLDSNFWLATHVVAITIGYSTTFLAGTFGIVYIVRGLFTKTMDEAAARQLSAMTYGVICFSLFFSFVGTVLGGIWADQSWGRFWGWDPKENGAVLIVIWMAIILHARWGAMIRRRGLACLAVAGNIITAWSWFGTNMLSVGLHSYGFMDQGFKWMIFFIASQLLIITLGCLPPSLWRSQNAVLS